MIFYNNLLAKCFLGKKKHYFMIGVFFIDFNPSIGFVTMVFMVVDGASVHDISLALLV